jgi:hypothetical protein
MLGLLARTESAAVVVQVVRRHQALRAMAATARMARSAPRAQQVASEDTVAMPVRAVPAELVAPVVPGRSRTEMVAPVATLAPAAPVVLAAPVICSLVQR